MATFYARKANKILKISADAVDRYLSYGYNITDEQGTIIKKGTPHNTNQLTAEYKKQEEEIASLKAENASLTAEVKALKAEIVKIKSEVPVISATKTSGRKRKQNTSEEEVEE